MSKSRRKTTQEFLDDIKLKGVWNDNYDYSKVEYTGASKKVIIIDKRYNSEHLIQSSEVLIGTKCTGSNLLNGYWNYDDSSNYIQRLENPPKSYGEWIKFSNTDLRPHQIPSNPQRRYKDVWKERGGWGGFLGTNRTSDNLKEYPPFEIAKKELQKLNITSRKQYYEMWDKGLLSKYPKTLHNSYSKDFTTYSEFLGFPSFNTEKRYFGNPKHRKFGDYKEHQRK